MTVNRTSAASADLPPLRPDGWPILHHFPRYQSDPLAFWLETGRQAPVVRVRMGPSITYWVVTDPDFLQHILQRKARVYIRERRLMAMNRGRSAPELLFNTDSWDEWLWRRRLMQPSFHRRQIAGFAQAMVEETTRLLDGWRDGAVIDLAQTMKTLTMRIIARTMFSVRVDADTEALQESFVFNSYYVFRRASAVAVWPEWVPTPFNRRNQRLLGARIARLQQIVDEKYQQSEPTGDLLDMLIATHLEDGQKFSAEQLVWEMSGLVFAGHETTALTQMWLFYLLTQHLEVKARLVDEVDRVLGDRPIALEDLDRMPYTEQVINETMRLYPPVYVTLREADEDDTYGAWEIPRGTRFVLNIRGLHRDPALWDEPERFDPGRFAPERGAARHKFAFLPFIAGPRKCIGDSFAMMEMRLIVPTVLQRFRLHYAGNGPPVERPSFVMEAAEGMPVRVEKRKRAA